MKKISSICLTAIFVFLSCSCSSAKNGSDLNNHVISYNMTIYEDSIIYEASNSAGESVLCCYSKDSGKSAVMCGLPECTHMSETSPNCGALMDANTFYRCGYNIAGNKLYYIAVKNFSEKSMGSVDLIECDIDGKNKRTAASLANTNLPFITDVQYLDNHVLITYFQNFDVEENENTGENEFVYLDKYRFYIKRIEISTGNIETLVYREEYDGRGSGTVYNNILYYNYTYRTEAPTGEMLTPETATPQHGGFYIRDLSTGEEKEYKDMTVFGVILGHFSPDRMIAHDRKNGKLCLFDSETEKFTDIADYDYGSYTEDEKDALFTQSSKTNFLTRYNFESGELSQMPYSEDSGIYPNLSYTVGNTVWLVMSGSEADSRYAYIEREDFFAGKFDNLNFVEEVNLQ